MKNKSEVISNLNGNYYGTLRILNHKNKYYWIIEDYDTDFDDLEEWNEISEELYKVLKKENSVK